MSAIGIGRLSRAGSPAASRETRCRKKCSRSLTRRRAVRGLREGRGRFPGGQPGAKRRISMRLIPVTLSLAALLPGPAAAQTVCRPPAGSHEVKVFGTFAVPLAFGPLAGPPSLELGQGRIQLEGSYLPTRDAAARTPTICRPGKGPENTDFLFALPRPRLLLGGPARFQLELSWIPPIRINGAKANLVGLALARAIPLGRLGEDEASLGLRVHGTLGVIRAPITCDDPELENPNSECYQGTRSDDRYHPNVFGAEGSLGWALARG